MLGEQAAFLICVPLLLLAPAIAWSQDLNADEETIRAVDRLKADGFLAFGEKRYAEGIELMQRADSLVPHPNFAFNIAWAYFKWGKAHCEASLAAFDDFFARCGDCESKPQVEERHRTVFDACAVRVRVSAATGESLSSRDLKAPLALPAEVTLRPGMNLLIVNGQHGHQREHVVHVPPRFLARLELLDIERAEVVLENFGAVEELQVDGAWGDMRSQLEFSAGDVQLGIPLPEGTARLELRLSPGQRLVFDFGQVALHLPSAPAESNAVALPVGGSVDRANPDLTLSIIELGLGAVSALAAGGFLVASVSGDGVDAPKWSYITALSALSFGANGAALQFVGHEPPERRRTAEVVYGVVAGLAGAGLATAGVYFYATEPSAEVGHAYLFPAVPCLVSAMGVLAFGTGRSD